MPRRVVLVTVGSLGDLHPFMALGVALRELGITVVLVTAEEYRSKVERAGLPFAAARPSFADMQGELGMSRAELTAAILARPDFLFRRVIVPHLRDGYADMLPLLDGADLVLTSSLAFGARLAAERREIPWLAVVLQPLMFMSACDPPVIPHAEWLSALLRHLGPRATRPVLGLIKAAVGRFLRPLHDLRREIGLPPSTTNPVFEGQFSAAGAIGLYSALLGGVQRDYPHPTTVVGFAAFDSEDGAGSALPPGLDDFLRAGDRPLVFTLGSLIVNSPGKFYRESIAAAALLNRRAVLLVGTDALPDYRDAGSPNTFVCAYAPHSLLFPRAEAIVHQCGVGTLAQALRSGRPQLIVPFYADQMDNARRAAALKVARVLSPRRYDRANAARELRKLLSDALPAECAARVAATVRGEDGARAAAQHVSNQLELTAFRRPG